ncbi:hypothetical protein ACTA71_007254, partial [Dictyostelium dimigraforme]
INKKTI